MAARKACRGPVSDLVKVGARGFPTTSAWPSRSIKVLSLLRGSLTCIAAASPSRPASTRYQIMKSGAQTCQWPRMAALLLSAAVLTVFWQADVAEGRSVALPSPQCHPAVVKSMKPRIRQICKALEAIWQFSDNEENYLDDRESEELLDMERPIAYADRSLINSVKRKGGEDVDHVFLRFGRSFSRQ